MSESINLRDPNRDELPSRIRGGLKWKLISEFTWFVSRFTVAVVLAHLLSPRDFGIAGMVLVLSTFVITFADAGFGNALVQRRALSEQDRSTVFWTSLGVSTALTLLGVALAGPVASFYHQQAVRPLFVALSLSFLVTALGATHRSLLSRAMDFRRLELRSIVGVVSGAVVGISVAALGYGPWALIIQSVTILTVSTVLLWILVPWRPRFMYSIESLKQLGGFGIRSVGASLFLILNQISDKLLIGRFLGAAPLGVYTLAYNTMLLPLSRIVAPVQQVLYPAFSRLQDETEELAEAWVRACRLLAVVCMPLMLGIMITAPDLVPLVFGHRWISAVPVLQILAWVSIAQVLQGLNPVVLAATNHTQANLVFSGVMFIGNFSAFVIGLHWGINGVATAFAISMTILCISYAAVTARLLQTPLRRLAAGLAGVTEASIAMVGVAVGVREFVLPDGFPPILRLVVVAAVGGCAFVVFCAWRTPELIAEVTQLLRTPRRLRPPASARVAET